MLDATLLTISIAYCDSSGDGSLQIASLHSMLALSNRIATTTAESASLWAIRFALLAMFIVFVAEANGKKRTNRSLAVIWLFGASLSLCHGMGTIATFHNGSQSIAWESTAQQTEALIGLRIGAGLFVNYAFILIWLIDSGVCLLAPKSYDRLPKAICRTINGFLIFIAINGAIVFQPGWTRWIGILCVAIWITAILNNRLRLALRRK